MKKHLTNPTIHDIIHKSIKLFALHTNLQYKLNRPEHIAWSRVTIVTVEFIAHGTVSYIIGFVGIFISIFAYP